MKFLKVHNAQEGVTELVAVDNICNVVRGTSGHCQVHFTNGRTITIRGQVGQIESALKFVGHTVHSLEECLKVQSTKSEKQQPSMNELKREAVKVKK